MTKDSINALLVCGLRADGDFGRLHRGCWADGSVGAVLDQLFREVRAGSPHGTLGTDGLLLRLVAALVALRDRRTGPSDSAGLAPWRLKRALARIEADLSEDLPLADLAELTGLSPYHFCRAFARSTCVPPHRYRLVRKIARAKELLTGTTLPITEIAVSLGFSTSQHFAAAFRAQIGTTPSNWRRIARS